MKSAAVTLALRGAKRPKLAKIMVSQNTTTTKNGHWILLPICSRNAHRIASMSRVICSAVI
jgi:hypothetical protein